MAERYRAAEVTVDGFRKAVVIDDCRNGEWFCLIDPRRCFGDSWGRSDVALARAQDIARIFNLTANG